MINVYQVTYDSTTGNGNVPAIADRRLYEHLLLSDVGVVDGINISANGTNLIVSSGWGVIKGAIFQVEQETIQATVPASGSVTGRLLVELNVTNSTIEFVTQAESPLPALVQEDINTNGSIYQMPLATYTISTAAISGLTMVYDTLESIAEFKAEFDSIDSVFPAMQSKLDSIEQGAQVNTVTGVKGNAESTYRTGRVNLTSANIGAVPTSRTVNGKALSSNITLSASDIGLNPVITMNTSGASEESYLTDNWSTLSTGYSVVLLTKNSSSNKRAIAHLWKVSESTGVGLIIYTETYTDNVGETHSQLGLFRMSGGSGTISMFYN